jgi:hypothetical protein
MHLQDPINAQDFGKQLHSARQPKFNQNDVEANHGQT